MARKVFGIILISVFALTSVAGFAIAAEINKTPAAKAVSTSKNPAVTIPQPPRTSFRMISGKLIKVNSSDPANASMEVKSDMDNSSHTIAITPQTSITKVTDATDLKAGDQVRVVLRSANDKETAMGIVYGKIQNVPMPPQVVPGAGIAKKPPVIPVGKEAVKK